MRPKRNPTGIRARHSRSCPKDPCRCKPKWEAWVFSKAEGKKVYKSFPTHSAARGWRADALSASHKGKLRAPSRVTVREAGDALIAGMRDGSIRTRSGDAYKASATRSYDSALRLYIYPELGGARLSEVTRRNVQALADRLLARNLDPSTIRNALMPLRVIFRRALEDDDVATNPVDGVRLPAVRGKRDRIASPDEASKLLAALPELERALWACAFYGGLRRGELRGLRWEDVDLANGVIQVERSWDDKAGAVEPKSEAGKRKVPIAAILRDYLDEHKLRCPWSEGLVFGKSATRPFTHSRADAAWKAANEEARKADPDAEQLERITLHEARHCFASMMIAAGVNAKALSTYMGHSSVTITYDRYGHLMPGNEEEAAALLDAYLDRANTQARLASVA